MHDLLEVTRVDAADDRPRQIRLLSAAAFSALAWLLLVAAIYLFWVTVT
jgi:hypothetical protein